MPSQEELAAAVADAAPAQPSQEELSAAVNEGMDVRGPYAAPASPNTFTFSMEGMRSFGLRTKLGFGEGPKQKLDILRANGVDATLLDGDIHYLDPKTKEVKKINEAGFSVYDIADVMGEVPELVGMTMGGMGGAAVGSASGPVGTVFGGALGTSGGAMVGKMTKLNAARSFGADIPPEEQLSGVFSSGLMGLAADPVGRVVSKAIEKVAAPFAGRLVAGFSDAQEVLGRNKDALGRPLHVSAGQAVGGSWLENIAKGSWMGGRQLTDLHTAQEAALTQELNIFAKTISGGNYSAEELGAIYKDAVNGNLKTGQVGTSETYRAVERRLYAEVDKLSPSATVGVGTFKNKEDGNSLRGWAADQLDTTSEARQHAPNIAGQNVEAKTQKLQDRLNELIKNKAPQEKIDAAQEALDTHKTSGQTLVNILSDLSTLPDSVSFTTFQVWSSKLAALSRGGPKSVLNDEEAGILKDANRRLNMAAEDAGKTIQGKDAWQAYQVARNFSKEWRDVFNDKLVNALANADPQKFASLMFRPNQIEGVRNVSKAMGEEEFAKIKGAWMAGIIKPTGMEDITVKGLDKRLGQWDDATIREILNKPGEVREWTKLINAARVSSNVGSPSVAIQLVQPGALLALGGYAIGSGEGANPKNVASASAILLGPKVIAKIFASPGGVTWLTKAFTAEAGTKAASIAAANVTALAMRGEKGMAPEDLQMLSQKEAQLLQQKTEKARQYSRELELKKSLDSDGPPMTEQDTNSLEKAYPGSSRMSYKDLQRLEGYIK